MNNNDLNNLNDLVDGLVDIIKLIKDENKENIKFEEEKKDCLFNIKITDKFIINYKGDKLYIERENFDKSLDYFGIDEQIEAKIDKLIIVIKDYDIPIIQIILSAFQIYKKRFFNIYNPTVKELQQNNCALVMMFCGCDNDTMLKVIKKSGITFTNLYCNTLMESCTKPILEFMLENISRENILSTYENFTILSYICRKANFDLTFMFKKYKLTREDLVSPQHKDASCLAWLAFKNNDALTYIFDNIKFKKDDFLVLDEYDLYPLYEMCSKSNSNVDRILDEYEFTLLELFGKKFEKNNCIFQIVKNGNCFGSKLFKKLYNDKEIFKILYDKTHP